MTTQNEEKTKSDEQKVRVGQSPQHGGSGLFATRKISAGEVVMTLNSDTLFERIYPSVQHLEIDLATKRTEVAVEEETTEEAVSCSSSAYAREVLEHCVPGLSGKVYVFSPSALIRYENHSDEPNCSGMDYRWLDAGPGQKLDKVALRDIEEGEEVRVDYNGCSGYDVRRDEPMEKFLVLCSKFGVQKRPSQFQASAKS